MKQFLTHSNNPERSAVVWNMIASIAMAFQSVILLVVISHTPGLGLVPAGIYTMGNTLNNLFLCIGKYGTRAFQVSDVKREYSFNTYKIARIISVILMAVISVVYILITHKTNNYPLDKTIILIWMCIYKLPDAYEDVYYGEYQRNNRLDVASKATAIRFIINIVLWAILIITTKNMVLSVSVTTTVTLIIMFWFINITREYTEEVDNNTSDGINGKDESEKYKVKGTLSLLLVTFPLAISSFLALYIGTAPRISIDKIMNDASQAVYGYIAMPVFVVQLLLMFILNPTMYKLSHLWDDGEIFGYIRETLKQFAVIVVLTIICIVGAWLLGVPVLSILYNTDLKLYKTDLIIMMIASGFLALSTLFQILLTIMRQQKLILIGYLAVSLLALVFSDNSVKLYGIRGAVSFYLILLMMLCMIYFLGYMIALNKGRTDKKTTDK